MKKFALHLIFVGALIGSMTSAQAVSIDYTTTATTTFLGPSNHETLRLLSEISTFTGPGTFILNPVDLDTTLNGGANTPFTGTIAESASVGGKTVNYTVNY